MEKIGIVGATSPLGVHLVEFLTKNGYNVSAGFTSLDNVPQSWLDSPSIQCVKASVEDEDEMKVAFSGCQVVVWLSHLQQGRDNEREVEINNVPFKRFCDESISLDIKKIIFISSGGSVYGEPETLPIPESHPRKPLSSYGITKKTMEDTLISHGAGREIATAILRPGNIYGAEYLSVRAKGVIGVFIRCINAGADFTLLGDGNSLRDYVHVDDVCRAILCAIRSKSKHLVWNVGTGVGCTLNQILELIVNKMGKTKFKIIRQPAYNTDVLKNVLSVDRIFKECGFKAQIGIEDGIAALVKQFHTK